MFVDIQVRFIKCAHFFQMSSKINRCNCTLCTRSYAFPDKVISGFWLHHAMKFKLLHISWTSVTWTDKLLGFFENSTPIGIAKSKFNNQNNFKSYRFSPNLEGIAQKLTCWAHFNFELSKGVAASIFEPHLQILVNRRSTIGKQMIFNSVFCNFNRKSIIWEKL